MSVGRCDQLFIHESCYNRCVLPVGHEGDHQHPHDHKYLDSYDLENFFGVRVKHAYPDGFVQFQLAKDGSLYLLDGYGDLWHLPPRSTRAKPMEIVKEK